jgi:phenylpyruvate tautomerase PptA (4-oxalocrotonate tautomerase family)
MFSSLTAVFVYLLGSNQSIISIIVNTVRNGMQENFYRFRNQESRERARASFSELAVGSKLLRQ